MTREQKIESLRNAIMEKEARIIGYKEIVKKMKSNNEDTRSIKSRERQIENLKQDIKRHMDKIKSII